MQKMSDSLGERHSKAVRHSKEQEMEDLQLEEAYENSLSKCDLDLPSDFTQEQKEWFCRFSIFFGKENKIYKEMMQVI